MATLYHPSEAIQLLRPVLRRSRLPPRAATLAFSTSRTAHATQTQSSNTPPNASPPRRAVTVINDDGRVRWTELSPGEKAARTAQQGFNLGIVLVGAVACGTVAYFLFSDVFSPNSKTAHFNRAVTRIRASPQVCRLLGSPDASQISAHGEASHSRWARNRFIASSEETDKFGTQHMKFRFFVEGPNGQGVVHVHLAKRPSQSEYEYYVLAVDIKGHQRIYLENAEERKTSKAAPKIFGARWW